jgi:hypothetical protein
MAEKALTRSQQAALAAVREFLSGNSACFILKGSAGTGKTTLIASLMANLSEARRICLPLAPTGRAARILGAKTDATAGTVHGAIYALDDVRVFEDAQGSNDPGIRFVYPLKTDDPLDTVFIVDESSMVGDKEYEADLLQFGSGRLLADLIEFARLGRHGRSAGRGARIIFVGDPAQLPPVGDNHSPAMSVEYLMQHFGLPSEGHELTEVMRQSAGSAILDRATVLRDSIARRDFNSFELAEAKNEIIHLSVIDAADLVVTAIQGKSSAALITYTNAMALELNRIVRGRLWGNEALPPQVGDVLLINKNAPLAHLMNGDLVKILKVEDVLETRSVFIRGIDHPVPLTFRRLTVAYRDGRGEVIEIEAMVLENLLESKARELAPVEVRALLVDFRQRHPQLRAGTAEFRAAIRQDPYFNAVQVKYGYALTCHKAQGGEWDTVVVNFSDFGSDQRTEQFFRWAYTAITRARKNLALVAPPSFKLLSRVKFDSTPSPSPTSPSATEVVETADEVQADRDWQRFSFNVGQEALFLQFRRIRTVLTAAGIEIKRLHHGQFFEKYWLERGGTSAVIQCFYKSDFRVSSVVAAQGASSDPALLQECLQQLNGSVLTPQGTVAGADAFLEEFTTQVRQAVAVIGLRIVAAESGSYRLRLTFEGGGRRGQIDFHYDGKKRWTRAIEVGGPGSSRGIYEQVSDVVGLVK